MKMTKDEMVQLKQAIESFTCEHEDNRPRMTIEQYAECVEFAQTILDFARKCVNNVK